MLHWHQHLISMRRSNPVLQNFSKNDVRVNVLGQAGFELHRQAAGGKKHLLCLFNLSEKEINYTAPTWSENWQKILDSKEIQWLESDEKVSRVSPEMVKANEELRLMPLSVTVYENPEEV